MEMSCCISLNDTIDPILPGIKYFQNVEKIMTGAVIAVTTVCPSAVFPRCQKKYSVKSEEENNNERMLNKENLKVTNKGNTDIGSFCSLMSCP